MVDSGGKSACFIALLLESSLLWPWGGRRKLREKALEQSLPGTKPEFLFFSAFHSPSTRTEALREVQKSLLPGGFLLFLDYNTPRQRWRRLLAFVWFSPWLFLGISPRRRLRYPAAREAQEAGFQVKFLRLLGGECFQVVAATKPQVNARQA
jgi:hypothetical protein